MIARRTLELHANKGMQVAFKNKSNANRYIKELKKRGYRHETIRSSGPTVDYKKGKKRVIHAYYVIPIKIKPKRIIRKRVDPFDFSKSFNFNIRR